MSMTPRTIIFAVLATALVAACSSEQARMGGAAVGGIAGGIASAELIATTHPTPPVLIGTIAIGTVGGMVAGYLIADEVFIGPPIMVPPAGTVSMPAGRQRPVAANPDTAFYHEPTAASGYRPFGSY